MLITRFPVWYIIVKQNELTLCCAKRWHIKMAPCRNTNMESKIRRGDSRFNNNYTSAVKDLNYSFIVLLFNSLAFTYTGVYSTVFKSIRLAEQSLNQYGFFRIL